MNKSMFTFLCLMSIAVTTGDSFAMDRGRHCEVSLCTSSGVCGYSGCHDNDRESHDRESIRESLNEGIIGKDAQCAFVMPDGSVCSETEVLNAKIIMGLKKDYTFQGGPEAVAFVGTFIAVVNILRNTRLDTGIRFECAKEYVHRVCFIPNKSHYCFKNGNCDLSTYVYSSEDTQKINQANQDPILRALLGNRK